VAPVRIRRFMPADQRSVCAIEAACFGTDQWSAHEFAWYASVPAALFLVAARGARVSGYSVALVQGDRASLDSIGVRPSARRCGVASRLLNETIRRLRRQRIHTLTLMVRRDNHAAISLYRTFGFRRTGTVIRYYDDGATGWRMSLKLTPEV
jgi:ribosomal-protein-alanine N-acetyltransferase